MKRLSNMNIKINTNISKVSYIIFVSLAIILGFFLLYIALASFLNVYVLKNANLTEAKIISTNIYSDNESTYRDVTYQYYVDGTEYTNTDNLWWKLTNNNLKENSSINIYYNINNPQKSKVYHISYMLIIFSLALLIFPIIFLKIRLNN